MKVKYLLLTTFFVLFSFCFSQTDHIIYRNNGSRTQGNLDTTSLGNTSFRYKIEDSELWTFIHINEVKYIKS